MSLEVRLDDVEVSFGGRPALTGLTLAAAAGRVTGLVGPNGAGKTTAFRVLVGLVRPSAGSATVGGRQVADLAPGTVGLLLGDGLHPAVTGRRHLACQARALGLPDEVVEPALADVDLLAVADRRVRGWSLGQRQRLALATALLGDPSVLLLDEPVNGLDPTGVLWLRDRLMALAAGGATVLVSSHLLAELGLVAQDVVIMRGRALWSGPVADLTAEGTSLDDLYRELLLDAEPVR